MTFSQMNTKKLLFMCISSLMYLRSIPGADASSALSIRFMISEQNSAPDNARAPGALARMISTGISWLAASLSLLTITVHPAANGQKI